MKELSIEEKAKRYDEAIETARKINIGEGVASPPDWTVLEVVFPELKESDDERIRNLIYLSIEKGMGIPNDRDRKKALTWIENQGEHARFIEAIQVGDKVTKNEDGVLVNLSQLNRVAKKDEKQGEQKPIDKTEQKFHEGDWVVRGDTIAQILDIQEQYYVGLDIDGNDFTSSRFLSDDKIHLWTIQDAKEGDILCDYIEEYNNPLIFILKKFEHVDFGLAKRSDYSSYCFLTASDRQMFKEGKYHHKHNIKPATKEQRELLFKMMKESGCEWDAEKKELKKIEQKQVMNYPDNLPKDNWELLHEFVEKFGRIPKDEDELNVLIEYILKRQKSNWNEEDEAGFSDVMWAIKQARTIAKDENDIGNLWYAEHWLKSLKDRLQLK